MSVPGEAPRLRIAWLLQRPIIGSGGFTNIFRTINLLATYGHESVIYMPLHGLPAEYLSQPERYIARHFGPVSARVQPWPDVIDQVDVALATQWSSFELLNRCAPRVARAYFVQDFEPFFVPMGYEYLQAEATYRAGVPCITLGEWLAAFLRDRYGATTYPFDFAVDHQRYQLRPRPAATPPRIIFYARPSTPRRCFDLGKEALAIVHRRHPDAEIVLFGDTHLSHMTLPFPFVDMGILNEDALASLYASATVGLVLSSTNPSLMPPEMMAAGCAVVDLDLPPNHFLIEHERTGLLAAPEPQALAGAICRLLEDESLRSRLVANAHAAVQPLSWAHSARQVEAALLELATPRFAPAPALIDLEQPSGEGTTPPLSDDLIVGQRFLPRHDGICRIAVGVSTPGGETPTLRIYDSARPESLLLETSAAQQCDGWLMYEFAPLAAVGGRALYLTLSAGDGPRLRFTYRPAPGESLAYNHVPQVGQLMFRLWYRPPLGDPGGDDATTHDELDRLYARQRMAAIEQELVSAYLVEMHRQFAQRAANGRLGRGRHVLRRLWQGDWRGLLRDGGAYLGRRRTDSMSHERES